MAHLSTSARLLGRPLALPASAQMLRQDKMGYALVLLWAPKVFWQFHSRAKEVQQAIDTQACTSPQYSVGKCQLRLGKGSLLFLCLYLRSGWCVFRLLFKKREANHFSFKKHMLINSVYLRSFSKCLFCGGVHVRSCALWLTAFHSSRDN